MRGVCSAARVGCIGLLCLSTACSSRWEPVDAASPLQYPAQQLIRVWAGDSSTTLRKVAVRSDSIRGIPWRQPLSCASCEIAIALGEIDSLRTGRTDVSAWRVIVGVGAVVGIYALAMSRAEAD
jgi:hypothetical protein